MATNTSDLAGLRVFISYARGGLDHTWAEKIQRHLADQGADVWRDEHSIEEGNEDWCRSIERGIERADAVVCIVGRDTDDSRWQQREIAFADKRNKEVVVIRTDDVELPFGLLEKQPIEVRPDAQETLDVLSRQLTEISQKLNRIPDNDLQSLAGAQRREELAYLNDLIHKDYSDREKRYVALEASERRSNALERVMNTVMDTDAVLKDFGMDGVGPEQTVEKTYTDALDAYRDLQHKPVCRLAVLGEPGAGKSFSLQRIVVEYAQQALKDPEAPIPLLVPLGFWTRESLSLEDFIERHLDRLGRYSTTLRDQRRAVLLLDGMNEIPAGQRQAKVAQIRGLAQDTRFASVVVSCREKDFVGDSHLPFDTLILQPLRPSQVMAFLVRAYTLLQDGSDGVQQAENRFWQLAGGDAIRQVWTRWRNASEDLDLFWNAGTIPENNPNIREHLSWEDEILWWKVRFDPRNLLRLASNPYLLTIITALPQVPSNRAQLFQGFLQHLYRREHTAREKRHERDIPDQANWEAALVTLAEAMQRAVIASQVDGVQTALPRTQCPDSLTGELLDFAIDASVLQVKDDTVRFTHQLLQEYLASRLFLDASGTGCKCAADFWPQESWWERTGWEVVAEIAGESCGSDADAQWQLIAWLAKANPEVACEVWRHVGQPELPQAVQAAISDQWFARMTDVSCEPDPRARAAIGRALGNWHLDRRKGVGLCADGLPDIDWVEIPSTAFIYQDAEHPLLPPFSIARYPVTNAQFQAFIDANGYQDEQWWQGLAQDFDVPASPGWSEPNSPRETVSWYEAIAFCRWLTSQLGFDVYLPTEQQWELAARGTQGLKYPWGKDWQTGYANHDETWDEAGIYNLGRTSSVGLYLQPALPEGVLDMAGNVWEWCLNQYFNPDYCQLAGNAERVLRGGSWSSHGKIVCSTNRSGLEPYHRHNFIGFRLVRGH